MEIMEVFTFLFSYNHTMTTNGDTHFFFPEIQMEEFEKKKKILNPSNFIGFKMERWFAFIFM